jgi:hypothetical protein
MQIDQYGSNLGRAASWPVALVVLEQARAAPRVSPPVDSSTLLTTGSDYDSEDSLGSPAKNKGGGRGADEEGGKMDDESDRRLQRPVLLETPVPRSQRTKTMQVGPARKSARL